MIKTDNDFMWAVGKKVKVTTYEKIDGKNTFLGTLVGLASGTVVVDENGVSTELTRDKIASARLAYDI